MKGGFPDAIKLRHGRAMILTRTDVHDLRTDLERDARRQGPITIELRRQLAEVSQVHPHRPIRRKGGCANGR